MKIATAVLVLMELFVSAVKADFILKYIVETSGQRFEVATKQTDTNLRFDSSEYSVIESFTGNNTAILFHTSRTWVKLDSESLRFMLSLTGKLGGQFKTEDLKPTGKTETINGYETREFKGSMAGIQISVFVTENFQIDSKIEKMMRKWADSPAADAFRDIVAVAEKCPGFPIRIVYEVLGTTSSLTFKSLEEARLDDSEFAVPSDYKEMPLPEFLGH